jgi:hypothetical protein
MHAIIIVGFNNQLDKYSLYLLSSVAGVRC